MSLRPATDHARGECCHEHTACQESKLREIKELRARAQTASVNLEEASAEPEGRAAKRQATEKAKHVPIDLEATAPPASAIGTWLSRTL